jgi:hypothetical protein
MGKYTITKTERPGYCELSGNERKKANLVIKNKNSRFGIGSFFVNDETFYDAIKNADKDIQEKILSILNPINDTKVDKVINKKIVLSEKEKELLNYDLRKIKDDEKKERFLTALTKLADKYKIDYNSIKEDDYKKLRDLLIEKLV